MSVGRIPILTYHGLDAQPSPLLISPARFESHLAALADSGRKTLPLGEVLDVLRRGEPLPANTVVITFDDGYESVYREAWPRLRAFGFQATIFLITDYCGRDNRWPGQPAWVPTRPLLTWAQVETMSAEGCEFGAHTRTHPSLLSLPLAQAEDEIVASQQAVHEHAGQPVRAFAYPYGAVNAEVHNIVRRRFDGATSTRLGLVQSDSDRYDLERIDAYYLTPRLARSMSRPSFRLYLKFRQILRAARRWFVRDWQPTYSAPRENDR